MFVDNTTPNLFFDGSASWASNDPIEVVSRMRNKIAFFIILVIVYKNINDKSLPTPSVHYA
jgi:hypothetical protein